MKSCEWPCREPVDFCASMHVIAASVRPQIPPSAVQLLPDTATAAPKKPTEQQKREMYDEFSTCTMSVSQAVKAVRKLYRVVGVEKSSMQVQSQVYVLVDQVSDEADELSFHEFCDLVDLAFH